ncbi:hypothetical protein OAA10_00320 [bacterium]|nr:hypothetical protein [bacterium]
MIHPYPQHLLDAAKHIHQQLLQPLAAIKLACVNPAQFQKRVRTKDVSGIAKANNNTQFYHWQYEELIAVIETAKKLSTNLKATDSKVQELIEYWVDHRRAGAHRGFWSFLRSGPLLSSQDDQATTVLLRSFES